MILCDPPIEGKKDSELTPAIPIVWQEVLGSLRGNVLDTTQQRLGAHQVEAMIWRQVITLRQTDCDTEAEWLSAG